MFKEIVLQINFKYISENRTKIVCNVLVYIFNQNIFFTYIRKRNKAKVIPHNVNNSLDINPKYK